MNLKQLPSGAFVSLDHVVEARPQDDGTLHVRLATHDTTYRGGDAAALLRLLASESAAPRAGLVTLPEAPKSPEKKGGAR